MWSNQLQKQKLGELFEVRILANMFVNGYILDI